VKQISATAPLSRQQAEVLRLFGHGKTAQEAAANLKIKLKTVLSYCERLKKKLHAANLNQLIITGALHRARAVPLTTIQSHCLHRFK